MTEAGEKWAVEFWKSHGVPELAGIGLKRTELLLRAFCDEVDGRAVHDVPKHHALGKAFDELRKELL